MVLNSPENKRTLPPPGHSEESRLGVTTKNLDLGAWKSSDSSLPPVVQNDRPAKPIDFVKKPVMLPPSFNPFDSY